MLQAQHSRKKATIVYKEKHKTLKASLSAAGLAGKKLRMSDLDEEMKTLYKEVGKFKKQVAAKDADVKDQNAELEKLGARPGLGEHGLAATPEIRKYLIKTLSSGKPRLRTWSALAIGVLGHGHARLGLAPDDAASLVVRHVAADNRRPHEIGAHALAVGMRGDPRADGVLLDKLAYFSVDEARGFVAVGLGLITCSAAVDPITEMLRASRYRPTLIREAPIALGLLRTKEVVPTLVEMLRASKGQSSQAGIASALGLVGDVRSVEPLLAMIDDRSLTDGARAFAVVSLGLVCEPTPLPWNAPIKDGINYLATTSTLVAGGMGILEIL